MSSGCGDVLSLADLETAKKHQLFEAEVITGKVGGVASGADIDYATNQVTGQTQKTLPAVLRDVGFEPATFDFTTGGTLTVNDRNKVVYDPVSKTWYSWAGTLPKVIPAGTNPAGIVDWVPQTDPNLRSDLASVVAGKGADMVGYTTPMSNTSSTVADILDIKYPAIIGNVSTPATGLRFESYESYTGNHDIRFTNGGSVPAATKRLKKTGNATVTLTSTMGVGTPVPPLTVDTVAYVNDAQPQANSFPARTRIDGITFEGDDAGGQCGLAILQGQEFEINRVGFLKTKIALWLREVWMTSISNVVAWGQILHEGGTSTTYSNCFAKVTDTSVAPGAYRISNQQYGNMRSCASDGTVNGAYWFNNNNGLAISGCGAEVPSPSVSDVNQGVLAHFQSGNDMTLTDFYCLPASGTNILMSVIDNNNLTFNNFLVYGDTTKYSRDLWVHGAGNNIVLNGGSFGGSALPRVAFSVAGSTVRYNTPTNSYIYKATAATNLAVFEPFSLYTNLGSSILITFGAATTDVGGASVKDIKMRKEGGLITVEFYIAIPTAGGQTGQLRLRGFPYASSDLASGCISAVGAVTAGIGQASISMERGATSIEFFKTGTGTSTAPLTNTDLSPGATLRGSITYNTSTWFG